MSSNADGHVDDEEEIFYYVLDKHRGYTDLPWLIVGAAFVLATAVLCGVGFSNQQLRTVVDGMDWRGRHCGIGDLKGNKLKMWANPLFSHENMDAGAICVEKCPVTTNGGQVSVWGTIMCVCNPKINPDVSNKLTPLGKMCQTAEAKRNGYAFSNAYQSQADVSAYVTYTDSTKLQPCTFQHATRELMHMCLPALDPVNYQRIVKQKCGKTGTTTCGLTEHLSEHLNSNRHAIQRLITDFSRCWGVLLICGIFTLIISVGCFFAVQYEMGVPIMLWQGVLSLLAVCWAAVYTAGFFSDRANATPTMATAASDRMSSHILIIFAWVAGGSALFRLIVTWYLASSSYERHKISVPGLDARDRGTDTLSQIASNTLVLGGQAMWLVPSIGWSVALQVLFTCGLLIGFFSIAFALASAGSLTLDSYGVSHLEFNSSVQWSLGFHIIMFFWTLELADVIVLIIGGGVVAVYVFAPTEDPHNIHSDNRKYPTWPLWFSFTTMGKYHIGTMVAAATWLTFTAPLRLVTALVHWAYFGASVPYSRWDSVMRDPNQNRCLKFYATYVMDLVRGKDRRCVVQTVLHGSPFNSACYAAWHLNKANGKYMSVPLYTVQAILTITRDNVALAAVLLGHVLIVTESCGVTLNELQSTFTPLLVIFFLAHVISGAFLSHLEAAVIVELVGFAEAKLRICTPAVQQLTVPQDLVRLCEESASRDHSQDRDQASHDAYQETVPLSTVDDHS